MTLLVLEVISYSDNWFYLRVESIAYHLHTCNKSQGVI